MTKTPIIEVVDGCKMYSKSRNDAVVFEHLNLSIQQGEFVALMGPSGSGKTTLLHSIGGLEKLTSGQILIGGQQIDHFNERQLARLRSQTIGFIFQFYNLMPMLNAAGNIELPLMLTKLGQKERRRRVDEAAEIVGIRHRLKHRPNELSGGEQQRVAIARALVSDPPILLCDEPTGDLDRATATEVMKILQLLGKELGKTIVMVTHDPSAADYADQTYTFNKGEISKMDRAA
ncbi:ABC transporter ATP-binding protein [Pseudovibrio denitrificans]|uniref:ABC transporter ATP-binding protein n=1 Tax=Pseudovibrio denitrificans TaxID=258256 RepID=UPI0039BF43BA